MAKFAKGQSGNPAGRPKAQGDLRELARQHTDAALAVLVTVMNDVAASASARVNAATALLDRAHGRPVQTTVTATAETSGAATQALMANAARLLDKYSAAEELQNRRETDGAVEMEGNARQLAH